MHARYVRARRRLTPTAAVLCAALLAALPVALPTGPHVGGAAEAPARADGGSLVPVLIGVQPGAAGTVTKGVLEAGGRVVRRLRVIDAYAATLPAHAVPTLAARPGVTWLRPDAAVRLSHTADHDAAVGPTSLFHLADTVRAKPVREDGYSGAGVDVAVIDSGVVPVDGLTAPGKVVNGPDLSFESGADELRHLDTYGHGTHMAGIIAGRDDALTGPVREAPHDRFAGIAPDARIVNVKVAASDGTTDVSQVIAGIDWVVQHRRDNGLNIRVLNLSFGTDGVQDYRLDPLSHAVEQAWRAGIVVVVAGGNDGYGDARLNNPAVNPYVIAVGGADGRGTVSRDDDIVADWSSRGAAGRHPDLVAPGRSVVSLRDPGSRVDLDFPGARVGERFFRGTGTSQAAAVVSGAAAVLLQQRPGLSPDQVKALLTSTAWPLPGVEPAAQGAGLLDVAAAAAATTPTAAQSWPRSQGTGSLEAARGSAHVTVNGTEVTGERSVFLTTWDAFGWVSGLLLGGSWSGGSWEGNTWTGNTWTGGSWLGNPWTGNTWTGNTWTGNTWTGNTWTGNTWTRNTWSGNTWSGNTWSGNTWSGNTWSSAGW